MIDVVCFGQQNWDFCWTGKQQLLSRLARYGGRILYVDPDVDPQAEEKWPAHQAGANGIPGVRKEPYGDLWIYSRKTPRRLGYRLGKAYDRRRLRQALRQLGIKAPVVMVLRPLPLDWLNIPNPSGMLYYAVDEQTGFGGFSERDRRQIREREDALLEHADVVLGVSPRLAERFGKTNPRTYMLENGADADHYHPARLARCTPHPALRGVSGPVLGFIGQVDERMDQDLLLEMARRRPGWTIALAGRIKDGVDVSRLEAEPNILLLGYQPYETLPQFAVAVDVFLVPYVKSPLTESCNPLKIHEYLATGKPVVSTPLEGIVLCRDYIELALGTEEFVVAADKVLADPEAGRAERLGYAAENDWTSRVEALAGHLYEAAHVGAGKRGVPLPALRLMPARIARRRWETSARINEHGLPIQHGRLGLLRRIARRAAVAAGSARRLSGWLRGNRKKVRRILVFRNGRIGDILTVLPALAALRAEYPHAHITVAVRGRWGVEGLVGSSPHVDEVITLDFAWAADAKTFLKGIGALSGKHYDLVLVGGDWFFMAEALFASSERHFGVYDGHYLQTVKGRVLPRDLQRNETHLNLDLVEAVTKRRIDDRQRLYLEGVQLPEGGEEELRPVLDWSAGRPMLIVHPGTSRVTRRWPLDRASAAVSALMERHPDLLVVVTGVASEKPITAELVEKVEPAHRDRVRDIAGETGFGALIGLLGHARAVLSNDTGVMHLARAKGAALVATLGPENHRHWGPFTDGPGPAVTLRDEVPCAPCSRDRCAALYCLRHLPPDRVVEEVSRFIEGDFTAAEERGVIARRHRHLSWSALAEMGDELPLVTVSTGAASQAEADRLIGQIELQTYPEIEIDLVLAAGAEWSDRRPAQARRRLPVRVSRGGEATRSGGENGRRLSMVWTGDEQEWPGRIGHFVAQAMRRSETAPAGECWDVGSEQDERAEELKAGAA